MRALLKKRFENPRFLFSFDVRPAPRTNAWRFAAVILALLPFGATAQVTSAVGGVSADYAVVAQGANTRVWARAVPATTNEQGQVTYQTNSYTEIATGLNHLVNGQWVRSSENIQITAGGGVATNGQHQVGFTANINAANAVEIVTPDGEQLKTHIMGMAYFDESTGSNVLFGELQDSIGQVVNNNQVVYSNAFTDCDADVRYTYTRAGFEQDIIVQKQLPAPSEYGLNPGTTWLQVWTEFTDPPTPAIEPILDGADERLDFGVMKMERGKEFIMGNESNSVPVNKVWTTVQGRTFLVEQVQFDVVADQLQSLPGLSGGGSGVGGAGVQQVRFQGFPKQLPPAPSLAKRVNEKLKVAETHMPEKGLVLDYALVNSSVTNQTFQGDTTYLITGPVNLYNTTTIEGGTVVKFTNSSANPSLIVYGPVNCETGPYQMAVFSAMDDNTVGQVISGSTGSPSAGSYASPALDDEYTGGAITLDHLRISYAVTACYFTTPGAPDRVTDCQFVIDGAGIVASESYGTLALENALFANIGTVLVTEDNATIYAYNITVDHGSTFYYNGGGALNLTNSLVVSTGFYSSFNSGYSHTSLSDPGVFQSAGSGNYYLVTNSAYTNGGTTNIDPALLADLENMTTHPPLWLTNTITTNTTLSSRALGNTGNPDVGYHYDPIDYLTSCTVTNSTLTLTNGVVLAYYNSAGVSLQNNSQLISQGSPVQRNYFTYCNLVQEETNNLPGTSSGLTNSLPFYLYHTNLSQNPSVFLRFASFFIPGGETWAMYTDSSNRALSSLTLRDCEIYGGGSKLQLVSPSGSVFGLTNNLLQYTQIAASVAGQFNAFNNLHRGGTNYSYSMTNSGGGAITNQDNAFDGTSVSLAGTGGYNAFLNGAITNSSLHAGDIVVTNFSWVAGPLGNFYQATNSPLLNKGSTSATNLGLYHYTVTTNEAVEGTNIVTIGYHYVALGTNELPLDSNGDGIPDYLEDANGDGLVDDGEKTWFSSSYIFEPTLWLDAGRGVATDGSGGVSLWADQSGNGNDASQTETGVQPTLLEAAFSNGEPAVYFNAANGDFLSMSAFLSGSTPAEAFVVLRTTSAAPAADRGLWTISGRIGGSDARPLHNNLLERTCVFAPESSGSRYPAMDGSIQEDFVSPNPYEIGIPAQSLTQYHVYNVVSANNGWTNRVNGVLLYSTSGNEIKYNSAFYLGVSYDEKYFDGDIAEVVIYNQTLTGIERTAVGAYLNLKYGLIPSAPAAPTNLTATTLSARQISLSWDGSLSNTPYFTLQRSTGTSSHFTNLAVVENAKSYLDTGLSSNTEYFYQVQACNYAGDSGYSAVTNATTFSNGCDMPVSNLLFWVKGDAGHQSDAGPMPFWLDQSGELNHAWQLGTAYQPQAALSNGLGAVQFVATHSDFLEFPQVLGGSEPAEAYVVLEVASAAPVVGRGLWWIGGGGGSALYPDTTGSIIDDFGSSTTWNTGTPVQSLTQYHVYNVVSTSNQWINRVNSGVRYESTNNTVSYGTDGNGNFVLGAGNGTYFDGAMAEVMIFDRTLSDAERNAVNAYLFSRYSISVTPPASPTNVVVINALLSFQLQLLVTNTPGDTSLLTFERKTGSGGAYSEIGSLDAFAGNGLLDGFSNPNSDYYYRITASNYGGSSTPVVIAPPTVLITNPVAGTPLSAGTNVTISVSATDPDGSVVEVELLLGSTLLGADTNAPWNFTTTTTNLFDLAVTALATDNHGNTRISALYNLPVYPNTSGDGRNDALDILLGLNPSTNSTPINPGDHTPPTINLLQPTNATPVY